MNDPRAAYDAWHAALAIDAEARAPWHRMVRARLDPERDVSGRTVLEVGCGRGDFACWLAVQAARPRRIVALDLSGVAVRQGAAYSSRHALRGVGFAEGDIQRLPHADRTFDTVFSFETIEHVERPRLALSELSRVLKRRGRLFLTTPNYFNVWGVYRIYLRLHGRRLSEAGQPINQPLLLPRTRGWVRSAGLDVVHVESTGHFFPTCPGRAARELSALERVPFVSRWMGQESLIVAEKP